MAAMGGKYSFPPGEDQGGHYSERFRELIRTMLRVNPDERPTIQQVRCFFTGGVVSQMTRGVGHSINSSADPCLLLGITLLLLRTGDRHDGRGSSAVTVGLQTRESFFLHPSLRESPEEKRRCRKHGDSSSCASFEPGTEQRRKA